MEEISNLARKYALQNAVKFAGKANPGAVIGKILAQKPDMKAQTKEIAKLVSQIIAEVNKIPVDLQLKELQDTAPELLEKKEKEERGIFEFLEIKEGEKVVTAFPPEPSKYPHIGHAKAIILNYELAKTYGGKFILRFEDTNPELAQKEFYDIHIENYKWLGIEPDKTDIASDYMKVLYEYAEKLINQGNAYICSCEPEIMKEKRRAGEECECRQNSIEENFLLWKKMFEEKAGKLVLRLKADMQSNNSTLRDPVIFRAIDETHARTGKKYRIWPNYDFENSIMDGIEGVTHRLRSKEFELRNELQRIIQTMAGFSPNKIYEFARFELEGVETSGRAIREKIQSGEYLGWDDPRLATLNALRRRGFLPKAIWNFVISTGITKNEAVLKWDDLIVHNRKLLDSSCNRHFFIDNPKEIQIENAPEQECELKLHPNFAERGSRKFKTHDKFYVSQRDYNNFKEGKLIRLMDCLNFRKEGHKFVFDSLDYESYKDNASMIIHWLPNSPNLVHMEVMMPDKTIIKGLAESSVMEMKEGEVAQFARFGFCKLDKKEKDKLHFWYTHD